MKCRSLFPSDIYNSAQSVTSASMYNSRKLPLWAPERIDPCSQVWKINTEDQVLQLRPKWLFSYVTKLFKVEDEKICIVHLTT